MDTISWIILAAAVVVAVAAFIIGRVAGAKAQKKKDSTTLGTAEERAKNIVNEALKTAETKKKESLLEAKEEIHRNRTEAEKEIRERRIDRWVNGAITVASTAASLVFYGVWMHKGFKFEETGTFTSTTFKGLFNRFRPMK